MQVSIRLLQEQELEKADQIFKLAFGTFRNHPHPPQYAGDMTYIKRWYLDPTAAFAAEVEGQLVGSNYGIKWGSFGLFGPLTVHPNYWGYGIAQRLIEPAMDCFKQWKISQAGFFTFSDSPLHLNLYQKFGFYPRFLTAIMSKPAQSIQDFLFSFRYSQLSEDKRLECLKSSREMTDTLYEGLDLTQEILTVQEQNLGDTIFLWDDKGVIGFAICHIGKNTEAGSDTCYIKFGAVRSDFKAEQNFEQLIRECETLSLLHGASRLVAGVNTARQGAYQQMLSLGFRADRIGVAMHKPNESAFNRSQVYVIDDWR